MHKIVQLAGVSVGDVIKRKECCRRNMDIYDFDDACDGFCGKKVGI